ncbi:hypothetical protein JCM19236_3922 [Vibrio sp. JCM 19236]|nr:hypothetical protein JCM19236_3922 [Vibrio sp. JCM 19236]
MRTHLRRRLDKRSNEEIDRLFTQFNRLVTLALSVLVFLVAFSGVMLFKGNLVLSITLTCIACIWAIAWTSYQSVLNQVHFDRQNRRSDWKYQNLR